MTRTSALLMGTLLAASLLAGCASGGFMGPLPVVTNPVDASNVTLYRDDTWVGAFGTMWVTLDGRELLRLRRNQALSFRLDPGRYILDYYIGLNECRRSLVIEPGRSYRFLLVPNCTLWSDLD